MPLTEPQAQAIRDEISTRLTAQWPYILSRQEAYRASHGHYVQGLSTHADLPADGAEAAPDQGGSRPTDQSETWLDVAQLPSSMLSAMEIDAYLSAEGPGFVVRLSVRLNGAVWVLERGHGPEATRDRDWHMLAGPEE
ncbi:MAG: hypothetical protein ACK47B_23730 [Armatimonadota bacterium]